MADNTLNAIGAARRAMEQVVGPAVSSAPSLVREQAELVAATLRMLEEQLPFTREHHAYELRRNIDLGRQLHELAPERLRSELEAALADAERLVGSLGPSDRELDAATRELTLLTSAVVRSSDEMPAEVRADVLRRVITHAGAVIEGQRAWFASQGWGGSGNVRPMSELYAEPDAGGTDDHRR